MSEVPKLSSKIKVAIPQSGPVWTGPQGQGDQGGITQSMIGRFLASRAHFKVWAIDGWQGPDTFKPALEYGNLWHLCEEATISKTNPGIIGDWRSALRMEVARLADKYPMDREKISHWYEMCLEQYPIYLDYWQEEGEIVGREPLLREQNFDLSYTLPSGKVVRLRGKWDGIDLVETPRTFAGKKIKHLYLYENKTKSQIDQEKLRKSLSFDLQTMYYLIALQEYEKDGYLYNLLSEKDVDLSSDKSKGLWKVFSIKGVLYNVIKRSAHKSAVSMMKKIQEDIDANRGGEWFGRWTVDISKADIQRFKNEFLHPILEQICLWYQIVTNPKSLFHVNAFDLTRMLHYRHPAGCYNPIDENGGTEVDGYLSTGSTLGLVRVKTLFPELENA